MPKRSLPSCHTSWQHKDHTLDTSWGREKRQHRFNQRSSWRRFELTLSQFGKFYLDCGSHNSNPHWDIAWKRISIRHLQHVSWRNSIGHLQFGSWRTISHLNIISWRKDIGHFYLRSWWKTISHIDMVSRKKGIRPSYLVSSQKFGDQLHLVNLGTFQHHLTMNECPSALTSIVGEEAWERRWVVFWHWPL